MIRLTILSLMLLSNLSGCGYNENKVLLTDTWACPKNATFQTWKDGYPGQEQKYSAIGCKDKHGNRVGYHIAWKDYGIKEHEGEFVNDEPSGEWSYYHDNGYLDSRGFFRNGKRDGIWSFWDQTGKFLYDKKYNNGELVETMSPKT